MAAARSRGAAELTERLGGFLRYRRGFLEGARAVRWFARLRAEIAWQAHTIRIFGREVAQPRLSCWVGDASARYTYSGTTFEPRPWTPALCELRALVQAAAEREQIPFRPDSVLCNLYRSGRDSMAWHSDDEPELGPAPIVASLSLGARRRFLLRRRDDTAVRIELSLEDGSLLWMLPPTQAEWQHAVPKTGKPVGERINLTFREL